MSVITIKQLLEAGVHFGHHTRRWNPKMQEYIYTERNGIYIIDLQKTVKKFEEAYKEYLNSQAPDLWGRINDRLDAKQQEETGEQADKKKPADNTLQKQLIEPTEPDLVICGERGLSNIKYVFVGSVSTYLIRNVRCDVLVVKQD